jgi:ATP-dependent DNA helicase RecG
LRIKVNIQTGMEQMEGFRERLTPDYPQIALRELLFNAVMHRNYQSNTPIRFYWYSDRIEIQNPGGLYGDVTPETLTQICSYRNPIVADFMKSLGFVNRFGYGIQRAKAML